MTVKYLDYDGVAKLTSLMQDDSQDRADEALSSAKDYADGVNTQYTLGLEGTDLVLTGSSDSNGTVTSTVELDDIYAMSDSVALLDYISSLPDVWTWDYEDLTETIDEWDPSWTRPDGWPDYDICVKRAGDDVIYLTCEPVVDDSELSFIVTTTDGGDYTVEIGSITNKGVLANRGFTADSTTTVTSGTTWSADLGTDSEYVVLCVRASTGSIKVLDFDTDYNDPPDVIVREIWGRAENLSPVVDSVAVGGIQSFDVTGGWTPTIAALRACNSAVYINARNLVPKTTLYHTFHNCSSLESVDVSGWDTSSVTTLYCTFYNCSSLESVDVSGWDTSSVTTLSYTFCNCSSLESVDVSGWDTSSVTTLDHTFCNCSSLESVDVSGWDTSEDILTTTSYAFYNIGVSELTYGGYLPLQDSTFRNSSNLSSLTLAHTGGVCPMENSNALNNTPIVSGNGYVYVPEDLVEEYQSATNWVTLADYITAIPTE